MTARTDAIQPGDLVVHTPSGNTYTVINVQPPTPEGHVFARLCAGHVLPENVDPTMVFRMSAKHLHHATLEEAEAATRAYFTVPASYEIHSRYTPARNGWHVSMLATWTHDNGAPYATTTGIGEAETHTVALVRALVAAACTRMRIPPGGV